MFSELNRRFRTIAFGVYSLCLVGGALAVVRDLVALSRGNATASHVIAVPFVTLFLLYQGRESIFSSVRWAAAAGGSVIGAGLALLLWGLSSSAGPDALSIKAAGLATAWVGGFLLFYGPSAFRAALFPLLFLAFTIPFPGAILAGATRLLKAGSSEAVAGLFSLTATPYHRDGFVFSLPNFAIEIADECSGIRSSIALLLTGLLAGQALLKSHWTKVLLVLAILPLTVVKNGIRIVSLSLLAMYVDAGFLTGQLHHEGGIVFFLLALAMLAPVLAFLRRLDPQGPEPTHAGMKS
ncbi:MAG TPA: exosortase/archaeosortase family protein [Vicinamibacterales bacterium]|nr:exosortase/archaeosortase family protein [Vicinamibacterales bacterium]